MSVHGTNSEQNVLRTQPENSAIWKKSCHGNLLGAHDLQIVLDKILPIWNLAPLWWNKATLTTTHLLNDLPLFLSSDLFLKLSPSLKSPAFPLLSTHSCILPTPAFFIGDFTFTCLTLMLSSIQLGNGEQGTDVRVRNNRLHCQNCYSNDEGKLLLFLL